MCNVLHSIRLFSVYEFRKFIRLFGVSSEIISDKGLTFENKGVAQFLVVIDIKWIPNS